MKHKYKDTIYYSDEQNDDFATTVKNIKKIPSGYKYISKNIFFKLFSILIYNILVRPLAWLYLKIRFHHKFIGKSNIKKLKKTGFFIYSNHVTVIGDAFLPNQITWKNNNYIIIGEQAASLRILRPILKALGGLPLSDDMKNKKELFKTIKYRIEHNDSVTIYPEAHVWPYYTKIRHFSNESFKYPAKFNVPIIVATTCFQKRRFIKRPKIVSVINGPYYPKEDLNTLENSIYLRDLAYNTMVENALKYSTYEAYKYEKKENEE